MIFKKIKAFKKVSRNKSFAIYLCNYFRTLSLYLSTLSIKSDQAVVKTHQVFHFYWQLARLASTSSHTPFTTVVSVKLPQSKFRSQYIYLFPAILFKKRIIFGNFKKTRLYLLKWDKCAVLIICSAAQLYYSLLRVLHTPVYYIILANSRKFFSK